MFYLQQKKYIKQGIVVKEGDPIKGVYVIKSGAFEKTQRVDLINSNGATEEKKEDFIEKLRMKKNSIVLNIV